MRRSSATALAIATAAWTGLVWAAEEKRSPDGVGAFATAAEGLARARGDNKAPAQQPNAIEPAAASEQGPADSARGGAEAATPRPQPAPTASGKRDTAAGDEPGGADTSATAKDKAAASPTVTAPASTAPASTMPDAKPSQADSIDAASAEGAANPAETTQPAATPPPVPTGALVPAKQLFGTVKTAAALQARAIGKYSRGCLAGAVALPVDGPQWQAMRLSRNRNWGHPALIRTIERLADEAWRYDGWSGLLVGDIAQPRGGPMLTGHASHQIGLDGDVWLTPMPDRRLSRKERETLNATSMLSADDVTVNRKVWTPSHYKLIKRVAGYERVERVLVHPGIKKALCEDATAAGGDRSWLHKVRPYWGHYYHFHIRIGCPEGSTNCTHQDAPPSDDGCGKELADWIRRVTPSPPSPEPKPPVVAQAKKPPRPPVTLADLPQECRAVLSTGKSGIPLPLLAKQARADKLIAEHAKALAAARHAHSKHGHESKAHVHKKAAADTAKPTNARTAESAN